LRAMVMVISDPMTPECALTAEPIAESVISQVLVPTKLSPLYVSHVITQAPEVEPAISSYKPIGGVQETAVSFVFTAMISETRPKEYFNVCVYAVVFLSMVMVRAVPIVPTVAAETPE